AGRRPAGTAIATRTLRENAVPSRAGRHDVRIAAQDHDDIGAIAAIAACPRIRRKQAEGAAAIAAGAADADRRYARARTVYRDRRIAVDGDRSGIPAIVAIVTPGSEKNRGTPAVPAFAAHGFDLYAVC